AAEPFQKLWEVPMRARIAYCTVAAVWWTTLLSGGLWQRTLAATVYWDGTGTSWANAASWSTVINGTTPDPAAPPGGLDIAQFNILGVNSAQTVNLNGSQFAAGLDFLSRGPVMIEPGTVQNSALFMGASGITVASGAGADTIDTQVLLSTSSETWTNNSSSTLTVNGGIGLGSGLLTIGGAGNTLLSNSLSNSASGLTKNGTGTLTLSGANFYTGATTISSGTVVLGNAKALGTTASGTSVAGGATLDLDGQAVTLAEALT